MLSARPSTCALYARAPSPHLALSPIHVRDATDTLNMHVLAFPPLPTARQGQPLPNPSHQQPHAIGAATTPCHASDLDFMSICRAADRPPPCAALPIPQ